MKKFISGLSSSLLLITSLGLHVNAESTSKQQLQDKQEVQSLFLAEEHASHEIIVSFKNPPSKDELQHLKSKYPIAKTEELGIPGFLNIKLVKNSNLKEIAIRLLSEPNVVKAEPNYEFESSYIPKEPLYKNQWYLHALHAEKAWDASKGENVTVAVIDAGVQVSHPDLKSRITKPYNAVTGRTTFPADDHGTHVAGIISASLNGIGTTGVAPNVKIMPVNVFSGESADTADIIRGIVYAADQGANIINMSLSGYGRNSALESAINYARSKGVIIVSAAGNDDTDEPSYPSSFPGVFSISSTDQYDDISVFSNFGKYVDFAAPGEEIVSTVTGNQYMSMDGTSMASPIVSGTIALMLSKNPLLTASDVSNILSKSSVDLGEPGWDEYFGHGRVDIYEALNQTPRPLENISVGNVFYMKGNNEISATIKSFFRMKVTANIQDSNGKMVKSFLTNQQSDGNAVKLNWKGTDQKGNFVLPGNYKLIVKAVYGSRTYTKQATIRVIDQIFPTLTPNSNSLAFSPKRKALPVKFSINKQAKVTARIYNYRGQLLQTLFTNKPFSTGNHYFYWTGMRSASQYFGDGTYTMKLDMVDDTNTNGHQQIIKVRVDTRAPAISIQSPGFFNKIDNVTSYLSNNETGSVTIKVINKDGQTVKLLTYHKMYNQGSHAVNWNGFDQQEQPIIDGDYQLHVDFNDAAGNAVSQNGTWITVKG